MRIGINGFGRIGRAIYRVNNLNPNIDIVVVNDVNPDVENIFYTLKYDTFFQLITKPCSHQKYTTFE